MLEGYNRMLMVTNTIWIWLLNYFYPPKQDFEPLKNGGSSNDSNPHFNLVERAEYGGFIGSKKRNLKLA